MPTKFKVAPDESGLRLDSLLALRDDSRSRSSWAKLINSGQVTVNGDKQKPKYSASEGDKIVILKIDDKSEPRDIEIIYQDENVVVINKPYGVLTHAKNELDREYTVADFVKTISKSKLSDREGIVHRLDRTTSGVMICALNEKAEDYLKQQFADRLVKKQYLAYLSKIPKDDEAIIDVPIARNPKKPSKFRVDAKGKESKTKFTVVKKIGDRALVKLEPYSGRTHQLRVHMAYIDCPILGDELYGGDTASRLLLHSNQLIIKLPDGESTVFKAEPPKDFNI